MPRWKDYSPYEKKYWSAMEALRKDTPLGTMVPYQNGVASNGGAVPPELVPLSPENQMPDAGMPRVPWRRFGLPTSTEEKELLKKGDVEEYYQSRLDRGDKYAATALGVVRNNTELGRLANARLLNEVLLGHNPGKHLDGLGTEGFLRKVNLALAEAHAKAVDADQYVLKGLLSANQITDYHGDYFQELGLPRSTFGGSLPLSEFLFNWCPECDPSP